MKVTVVHLMDLVAYPPVLSLLENLTNNGHKVNLISYGIDKAPDKIKKNNRIKLYEVPAGSKGGILGKLERERIRRSYTQSAVKKLMKDSDILWTTTDISVRCLGDEVLKYRHIMQLMELEEWYPYVIGIDHPQFPLQKYAKAAWKTVVPEINRGYIQKTWWGLEKTPYVLPNKPYSLEVNDEGMEEVLEKLKKDDRKKIMYLGIISSDRSLEEFAKATTILGDDFCLYVVGRIDDSEKRSFSELKEKYKNVEYLGYFEAPKHLCVLKYAYIGLLPYFPNSRHQFISPLNVQYCAPNKIFEYSAFGVPMIGTDVLGLRNPFETYNIGRICEKLDAESIASSVRSIESDYNDMRNNCKTFYDSVDLDVILQKILED